MRNLQTLKEMVEFSEQRKRKFQGLAEELQDQAKDAMFTWRKIANDGLAGQSRYARFPRKQAEVVYFHVLGLLVCDTVVEFERCNFGKQ